MIDSREQLIHVLTEAAEVEHNLLCSYLYAVFSLKRAGEPGLTEAQGQAVERWRRMILSVALQEMAHLACVNNLLLAVGGAPHFDRPNLPAPPGYHPAQIAVRLTPFDAATLDHFIFLERPDTQRLEDGEGFEPIGGPRESRAHPLTPSAIDYTTIGELYDALADGFEWLAERLGEQVLIDRTGRGQLGPDEGKLPEIARVTCLEQALAVIGEIKEQGEGSSGAREDSHFQRFTAIKAEWAELLAADPTFAPAWPAAHDPVMRRPADDVERVWIVDTRAARWLDVGNAAYGAMLGVLAQMFSLDDSTEQAALMEVAVQLMEVAAAAGNALARMPANPDHPGVNAGLTFAVPRNLGFRPGLSRPILLARIGEIRTAAEATFDGETLEKARRRLDACAQALA
jgi:hypothetical protein